MRHAANNGEFAEILVEGDDNLIGIRREDKDLFVTELRDSPTTVSTS